MTNSDRFEYPLLGILIFTAIVVRLLFINVPMRIDESFTFIYYVCKDPDFIMTDYFRPNNHILHSMLVWISTKLLGLQPWMIRLPALIAGVLTVPATYWAARILYDKRTAYLSAVMVTFSSSMIIYSTNARGYTIICLLTLLLIVTANFIRTGLPKAWVLFVLLATPGFYVVPTMIYPVGGILLWLLLEQRRKVLLPMSIALSSIVFFTALLYAPILVSSGLSPFLKTSANATWGPTTLQILLTQVWELLTLNDPIWLQVTLAMCCVIGCLNFSPKTFKIALLPSCALFCVPLLFFQPALPPARTFLPFLPLFAITVAHGFSHLLKRIPKADYHIVLSVLFALSIITVAPYSYSSLNDPWLKDAEMSRDLALFLKDNMRDGDKLLIDTPYDFPVAYYLTLYDYPTENIINSLTVDRAGELRKAKRILLFLPKFADMAQVVAGNTVYTVQPLHQINQGYLYEFLPEHT